MNKIQTAAKDLDIDSVKLLCEQDIDLHGTLLAVCSVQRPNPSIQIEIIEYLISKGAEVNETDKNGVTPIHRAVRFRSPKAVQALIEKGADVNAVDNSSHSTPLHRAVYYSGAPSTKGKKEEAIEIIQILQMHGANAEMTNKSKKTPLDYLSDPELKLLFVSH